MFESGIPRRFATKAARETPIAVCAALAWNSPAYIDLLATLVEFNVDFEEVGSVGGQSARSIIDQRAPGLYGLLRIKAHLVSSGAWPDFEHFTM